MVNLTGLKEGTILDPFCGCGGILIEAGLAGFCLMGFDFKEKMLANAKKNLEHFGLEAKLKKKDSTRPFKERYDAIVTELPFGKGSSLSRPLPDMVRSFLENTDNKTPRVISIPDMAELKNIEAKKEFKIFLHRSLRKRILLL